MACLITWSVLQKWAANQLWTVVMTSLWTSGTTINNDNVSLVSLFFHIWARVKQVHIPPLSSWIDDTCSALTLISSSEIYCNFRTRDLWADCLFARILQEKPINQCYAQNTTLHCSKTSQLSSTLHRSKVFPITQIRAVVHTDALPTWGQKHLRSSLEQSAMPLHIVMWCYKGRWQMHNLSDSWN
jgi:hypothetical protein